MSRCCVQHRCFGALSLHHRRWLRVLPGAAPSALSGFQLWRLFMCCLSILTLIGTDPGGSRSVPLSSLYREGPFMCQSPPQGALRAPFGRQVWIQMFHSASCPLLHHVQELTQPELTLSLAASCFREREGGRGVQFLPGGAHRLLSRRGAEGAHSGKGRGYSAFAQGLPLPSAKTPREGQCR